MKNISDLIKKIKEDGEERGKDVSHVTVEEYFKKTADFNCIGSVVTNEMLENHPALAKATARIILGLNSLRSLNPDEYGMLKGEHQYMLEEFLENYKDSYRDLVKISLSQDPVCLYTVKVNYLHRDKEEAKNIYFNIAKDCVAKYPFLVHQVDIKYLSKAQYSELVKIAIEDIETIEYIIPGHLPHGEYFELVKDVVKKKIFYLENNDVIYKITQEQYFELAKTMIKGNYSALEHLNPNRLSRDQYQDVLKLLVEICISAPNFESANDDTILRFSYGRCTLDWMLRQVNYFLKNAQHNLLEEGFCSKLAQDIISKNKNASKYITFENSDNNSLDNEESQNVNVQEDDLEEVQENLDLQGNDLISDNVE